MSSILYCPSCGKAMTIADQYLYRDVACPHCRHVLRPRVFPNSAAPAVRDPDSWSEYQPYDKLKSRWIAGILGILLGWAGIHRIYLGYIVVPFIQLLVTLIGLTFCGLPIGPVWGFLEGVFCLTGSMKDARGRPLD